MKKKYLVPIVINLAVVLAVFGLFVLLDFNTVRAVEKLSAGTNETNNAAADKPSVFPKNTHFEWSADHYDDQNVLTDDTNARMVEIPGAGKREMAYFSLKQAYYRFEVVRFVLRTSQKPQNAFVRVYAGTNAVPAFNGPTNLFFIRSADGEYTANWFSGWKPAEGNYRSVLFVNNSPVLSSDFKIIKREPVRFKKTLTLMDLEWNQMILNRTIFNHRFEKTRFLDGLIDWMDYGEIDAFMTLSGETTGWGNITPATPWEYYPVKNLQSIGEELHKRNKLVGAYIMCFYTPNNGWVKGGYQQAKGVSSSGGVMGSRFISFKDPKRFKDIVELARYFDAQPYVDFIGFDFSRFGELVGYENADEFVKDMNVEVPANWDKFGENDRILWLGGRLKSSGAVFQKWLLWIAHKTSDFIYRVRKEAGLKKPIWVFSLGWDHGVQHGQDPLFFQDAGVFADFVMLYESTPAMFQEMKRSWSTYLGQERLNYVPGNQIDAVLHKSIFGYNPVEEYAYRLNTAVDYASYYSRGAFIHDITRAFWGRKGANTYYEWLTAGFASVSHNRWRNGEIPFSMKCTPDNKVYNRNGNAEVKVLVEFRPETLSGLAGKKLEIEGVRNNYRKIIDISGLSNIIIAVKVNPGEGPNQFFALKGKIEGYPAYFMINYLKVLNSSEERKTSISEREEQSNE